MGCSLSRAHKTWSRSFLFKDFRVGEAGERVPRPIFHRATHRAFYGNRIPSGKEKLSPQTSNPEGEREGGGSQQ